MTSNRPYLIRALYEWIADNGLTPHLLVDAECEGAVVPRNYVDNGRIVLNVAPSAVQGLVMGNDDIQFSARFGGRPYPVMLPIASVLGVYARENGHGMLFPQDDTPGTEASQQPKETDPSGDDPDGKAKRPSLRVVK